MTVLRMYNPCKNCKGTHLLLGQVCHGSEVVYAVCPECRNSAPQDLWNKLNPLEKK